MYVVGGYVVIIIIIHGYAAHFCYLIYCVPIGKSSTLALIVLIEFPSNGRWSMAGVLACGQRLPYSSARMSPENTHKLMGFYTEVLILDVIL